MLQILCCVTFTKTEIWRRNVLAAYCCLLRLLSYNPIKIFCIFCLSLLKDVKTPQTDDSCFTNCYILPPKPQLDSYFAQTAFKGFLPLCEVSIGGWFLTKTVRWMWDVYLQSILQSSSTSSGTHSFLALYSGLLHLKRRSSQLGFKSSASVVCVTAPASTLYYDSCFRCHGDKTRCMASDLQRRK